MFDASLLLSAFEAHGIATRAYRMQVADDAGFIVGFVTPEQLILGDSVHTALIEIEYATTDAPALTMGTALTIGDATYRVNQQPRKQGDGTFSRASLEEARA